MPPKVSLVIPNWNGLHHLRTCLDAALAQTVSSCEVILVDNGSTDGSADFVAANYLQVTVLRREENLGFAAATNLGIRSSQGEYVATLNNDTQAEPTWLEGLVEAMDSAADVGMCASKLLFYDHRDVVNSAGIAVDKVGIAWDRDGGATDSAGDLRPREVFGPCAGAALYRRAMLDQIGLFDEDFFSYLEDVDLAWRGQAVGWRCLYVPSARVYHVHSATGQEGSPLKNRLLGRNKCWTIVKNYPWPQWLAYAPLILAYDLLAMAWGLVSRRDWSVAAGRLEALRALPAVLRKRRAIQASTGYSARLAFAMLSSVEPPWSVQRRYRHLLAARQEPGL
jgi:GT2 family glycosyltransferase